jgi:hypothetical protein
VSGGGPAGSAGPPCRDRHGGDVELLTVVTW